MTINSKTYNSKKKTVTVIVAIIDTYANFAKFYPIVAMPAIVSGIIGAMTSKKITG